MPYTKKKKKERKKKINHIHNNFNYKKSTKALP